MELYRENLVYYLKHLGYEVNEPESYAPSKDGYVIIKTGELICVLCPDYVNTAKTKKLFNLLYGETGKVIIVAPESKRDKFSGLGRFIPIQKMVIKYPECRTVPKFSKATEEELEDNLLEKNKIPLILYDDPMVIWSNAERGDVIKIECSHKISGSSIMYRLVT